MNATRRELSLAHLSVLDATPPELVTVAAAAGFRKIGIRISATPSVGIICDAVAAIPSESADLIREARTGRLLPGEGALPLRDLVAALPPTIPLSIEAPVRASAGLPALERAQRAYRSMRALLG
jgi:hypothetical protein